MNKNIIILVAAVVLAIVIGSWFFQDRAAVDTENTPTDRQEVPMQDGTRGVPPERQTP